MPGLRRVHDALDLRDRPVRPLAVHGSSVLENAIEHGQQTECYNGLLVEDVQLVADGIDTDACAGGQDGGLAD